MSKPRAILRRPIVTEKSMNAATRRNTYVFEVDPAANKIEIRRAVEQTFGVKVLDVRTLNRKGRPRARRRVGPVTRTPDRKRAYVQLAEGDVIDLI